MSAIYSDGSVESKILSYLMEKHSENGIIEALNEGAVFHNFTPARRGLLSWYPFRPNSTVLEIGGGMGSLTPVLAEKCAHVTVIEPSTARADIIRLRCEKYENVDVLTQSIQRLSKSLKFDYITVIGVLEYAGLGTTFNNPWQKFMDECTAHLKEGGSLLLAIENKWGLKYWSGAAEDHTGIPFDSISGYALSGGRTSRYADTDGTIRTFSSKELRNILSNSGLNSTRFYYPFPDYKFPTLILTDESRNAAGFIEDVKFNYPEESTLGFNEKTVWPEIIENGLLNFFSNSFFIDARKNSPCDDSISTVLLKRDYREDLRLITIFGKDNSVRRYAGSSAAKAHFKELYKNREKLEKKGIHCINQSVADDVMTIPYITLPRADAIFRKAEEQCDYVTCRCLLDKIRDLLLQSSTETIIKDGVEYLTEGYTDLTLRNCFIDNDKLIPFDQEYCQPDVPLNYLLYRTIKYTSNPKTMHLWLQYFAITDDEVMEFERRETEFLSSLMNQTSCKWFDATMYQPRLTIAGKIEAARHNSI